MPETRPFFFTGFPVPPFNQHWLGHPSRPASFTQVKDLHFGLPWQRAQHASGVLMWSNCFPQPLVSSWYSTSTSILPHRVAKVWTHVGSSFLLSCLLSNWFADMRLKR